MQGIYTDKNIQKTKMKFNSGERERYCIYEGRLGDCGRGVTREDEMLLEIKNMIAEIKSPQNDSKINLRNSPPNRAEQNKAPIKLRDGK